MTSPDITDILSKLCYSAGPLVGVEYSVFDGDSRFITAVRLAFEAYSVVFRAVPEDDTICTLEGDLILQADESPLTATDNAPWKSRMGRKVEWAWLLTNQQLYPDAIILSKGQARKPASGVKSKVLTRVQG